MTITLGILGGGQLGRMSAQAAKLLNIYTIIFTNEENSPASLVADKTILAEYIDNKALQKFADQCNFITYEFENIPLETILKLKKIGAKVYPDENLLNIAQDRIKEKSFLNDIGIPTTKWHPVNSKNDVEQYLKRHSLESAILKTTRLGYDGKGQGKVSLNTLNSIDNSFFENALILEEIIDFKCEISVIIARDIHGAVAIYGPVLNEHKDHILHKTTFPAPIDKKIAENAVALTKTLAEKINLIGVLALEMFVTKDGQILANEIAPRTHNSGHYSIDACAVSQFANHVLAVCEMAVRPPAPHSKATMINLIGEDIQNLNDYKGKLNIFIHDYQKAEIKPGRKMGHVTILDELK